jgi:hypothetical protein
MRSRSLGSAGDAIIHTYFSMHVYVLRDLACANISSLRVCFPRNETGLLGLAQHYFFLHYIGLHDYVGVNGVCPGSPPTALPPSSIDPLSPTFVPKGSQSWNWKELSSGKGFRVSPLLFSHTTTIPESGIRNNQTPVVLVPGLLIIVIETRARNHNISQLVPYRN